MLKLAGHGLASIGNLLSGHGMLARPYPASLFALSEPGVWFDPSDLSTLFQDSAGTTPVTAAGQPVGKILDKSGRGNHAAQVTSGSRPTYQVDGNGRAYLSFDGVDDFLVTGTITPGTDKAQVFAGVRKLSDVARGVVVEHGAGGSGFLGLSVPFTAPPDYAWQSGGTTTRLASAIGSAAPNTSVISCIGSISEDVGLLRSNGVEVNAAVGDQGTGNYGSGPIYIGRRGGTSLPLNGNLYAMIIRFGANLTASQIVQAETWVNQRTGAY